VAVDEEFRGEGIGSLILNDAIRKADREGCQRVVLDVALDNVRAKQLYEKIGFQVYNKKSFPWWGKRIGMFNMELRF
jgi:ribosomal protein S18 acetylase RimI-like enzyme